jgi:hypothetical protein
MRLSHTTKSGKAKCLHYRNGKRCGRVARHEVEYTERYFRKHQPVCDECLEAIHDECSITILQTSHNGFTVSESGAMGWQTRIYTAIA